MATFDIDEFLKATMQGEAAAATPPAPTSPATGGSTPFYNRPIKVPAGLKTAGRVGLGILKRASVPATAAALVMPGAELLKSLFEAGAGAIAGGPGVTATVERGRSGFGAVPRPAPTAEQGTEDFLRSVPAPVRAPAPTGDVGSAPTTEGVGGFFGALARLRGIQATQQARQAAALKAPAAYKDLAEQALFGVRLREAERARRSGAGPAEVAAIASGRSTGDAYTAFPDLTGQFLDVVKTRGAGAGQRATRLRPQPVITEEDIQATMKTRGMTREQVIERLKREGRY